MSAAATPGVGPPDAFAPWTLRGLRLRNRIIKAATYEGMSPGGRVSPALIEHHATLAARGVGLTTVAYGAVDPGGRTFADQLLLDDGAVAGLRALADAVRAAGGAVSVQLAHAGGFSKLPGPVGPSARVNLYGLASGVPWVRALDEAGLTAVERAFVAAARRAADAGVDAVEVHVGHGYLLHQFLSPVTNRRRDRWGGDLAARCRFPARVVRAVRQAFPAERPVLVKANVDDGHPGGLGVEDAVEVARAMFEAGADAIVLSGGVVDRSAFFLLRGGVPAREMALAQASRWHGCLIRLAAPLRIRPVPYDDLFFFDAARRVRAAVDGPVVLLGGVVAAEHARRAMAAGFDAVQVGRALIYDPGWVERAAGDEAHRSACSHCNRCVAAMDAGGVRCVEQGAPVVGPARVG